MPARDENVPVPRASTASLSARRHSHRRAAQASASKVAKRKRNALGSELSEDNANLPSSGSEWEAEIPPSESSSSSDHDDCDSSPIRAPGRKKPKMCADSGPSSSSRPLCEDHLVNPDSAGTSRDSSKRKVVEVGLDGRVSGANGTSAKRRRIRDSDLRFSGPQDAWKADALEAHPNTRAAAVLALERMNTLSLSAPAIHTDTSLETLQPRIHHHDNRFHQAAVKLLRCDLAQAAHLLPPPQTPEINRHFQLLQDRMAALETEKASLLSIAKDGGGTDFGQWLTAQNKAVVFHAIRDPKALSRLLDEAPKPEYAAALVKFVLSRLD